MGTVSVPSSTLCLISRAANGDICFLDRKRLEPKELLWQHHWGCHFKDKNKPQEHFKRGKKQTHHLCSLPDPSSNRASRRSPLSLYFTVIFPPDECLKVEDLFCVYSMVIVSSPLWISFRCFMTESNINTVEMLESVKWRTRNQLKEIRF